MFLLKYSCFVEYNVVLSTSVSVVLSVAPNGVYTQGIQLRVYMCIYVLSNSFALSAVIRY